MVVVHLSDGEKLQVVVLALLLFCAALMASVCLAVSVCPLHRWLLERHLSKKRRLTSQLLAGALPSSVRTHQAPKRAYGPMQGAPAEPPPTYEAVLRADQPAQQLHLGDYFHPPKFVEQTRGWPSELELANGHPPLMLRLWVRLLEPAELAERARAHPSARQANSQLALGRASLGRQLSFPQLLGSLVGLAGKLQGSQEPPEPAQDKHEQAQQQISQDDQTKSTTNPSNQTELDLSSMVSSASASSSGSSDSSAAANLRSLAPLAHTHSGPACLEATARKQLSGASRLLLEEPIASRVLHTNVASFGYVKDESLISTKRHRQLNQANFALAEAEGSAAASTSASAGSKAAKLCQLVISVCDVENALANGLADERCAALLADCSAVYVQADIVAAKWTSARLLVNPLRVLHLQAPEISASQPASKEADSKRGPLEVASEPTTVDRWRHQAAADGRSVVQFSTLPRPLGPPSSGRADSIQMDTVFVTPVLSKSLLERAHLRLRVFGQCRYVNDTCLAELKLPLRRLVGAGERDNLADASVDTNPACEANRNRVELILDNLLANALTGSTNEPLARLLAPGEQPQAPLHPQHQHQQPVGARNSFRLPWSSQAPAEEAPKPVGESGALAAELTRWERNQWRSLVASHWLAHLAAPAYECQPVLEERGRLLIGLSYLPTSNRVVFHAHRAELAGSGECSSPAAKTLRLQSSTCYLLRFLMVADGRVLRRQQTAAARTPEWDSQEPLTFDLASVSAEQPKFVVTLLMRNSALGGSGSLRDVRQLAGESLRQGQRDTDCAQSEPDAPIASRPHSLGPTGLSGGQPGQSGQLGQLRLANQRHQQPHRRDLVIGHLVLGERIWREMRAQPRKQIVRQFAMQ